MPLERVYVCVCCVDPQGALKRLLGVFLWLIGVHWWPLVAYRWPLVVLTKKSERVYVYTPRRFTPAGVPLVRSLARICHCMGVPSTITRLRWGL